MRDIDAISNAIADTIKRGCPQARAVGWGGSHGVNRADAKSDLDMVVLFGPVPLIASSRQMRAALEPVLAQERCLIGGPTWKEGFGCRTTWLFEDGFKVEVFANSEDTIPDVARVLAWKPIWGGPALQAVQAAVARRLDAATGARKAAFDVSYTQMSICRHLHRQELLAARHVLGSFVAIALAVRLMQRGYAYDPMAAHKRIRRDGLDSDPVVQAVMQVALSVCVSLADALKAMDSLHQLCLEMLDDITPDAPDADSYRETAGSIGREARSWVASAPPAALQ